MLERGLIIGAFIVLLSACTSGGVIRVPPAGGADEVIPVLTATADARTSTALIDFINALNELPEDRRDAAISAAVHDFRHARSPTSTLTLAVTLQALPANEQQSRALRALLATEPALPTSLSRLLSERLDSYAQARRIARSDTARTRRIERHESALAEQARSARADAAALRAALARAEAKIRALTSIEEEIGRSGSNEPEPR